jgi:coenzyme F420 hydrogenase subunit beta
MNTILAYAADPNIRRTASSGGALKGLLAHLLESRAVDGLVIARSGDGRRFAPEFIATDRLEELLTPRTNSVYHPADPRPVLRRLDPARRYAATLLPCQAAWLRGQQRRGRLGNVALVAGLVCNCLPAASWTSAIFARLGIAPRDVRCVHYRGEGWPGRMVVAGEGIELGERFQTLWGAGPGNQISPQCLRCLWHRQEYCDLLASDPCGLAPASIGDGKTVLRLLTAQGREAIEGARAAGRIVAEPAPDFLFDVQWAALAALKRRRWEAADAAIQRS